MHGGELHRIARLLVFDEVTKFGVAFAFADFGLHGNRLLGKAQNGVHALDGQMDFLGDFFRRRVTSQLLQQLLMHAHELVDRLDHMHRDADGARLIGDAAGDGLANPPGGVGAELVAALVLKLFHRAHEAHVAFLDEIQEGQAAIGVFFGDGDDQAQVGLDHLSLRPRGACHMLERVGDERAVIRRRHPRILLKGTDGFFGGVAAGVLLEIAFETVEIVQSLLQQGDEFFGDLGFEVKLLTQTEE